MTSQFTNVTSSSKLFDAVLLPMPNLVTVPSLMSISSLILELWKFSFVRDWPETWKSEILPSELWPISGNWSELGIPNFAGMSLMKCYWRLQNALTVSELLRENQQAETQIRINPWYAYIRTTYLHFEIRPFALLLPAYGIFNDTHREKYKKKKKKSERIDKLESYLLLVIVYATY